MTDFSKATCAICGHKAHILIPHILEEHGMSLEDYSKAHGTFLSEAAKVKLKAMQAQADNEKVEAPIKDLFGVKNKKVKTWKWKNPHPTTPAIDPNYVFRSEIVTLLIASHENPKERLLFTGETGSGKSSAIEQAAARLNVPFYRINLDNEVTKADFIGQMGLKSSETNYIYGVLALAMKAGAWLLVDEWDMGNPGVTAALRAVLEGKPLLIGDTGELVYPAEGFRIFATGNTIGGGDESGLYAGTQVQSGADLDRFTMVEYVDYPEAGIESQVVQRQCGLTDEALKKQFGVGEISAKDNSEAIVKYIVTVARLVRESFKKQEISATMSTRTLVNIGNKLLMFGDIKRAYDIAYLNKLNTEDRAFCSEIIQREWGF